MVAWTNPFLLPQSYFSPSYILAYTSSSSKRAFIASVNCISPDLSNLVVFKNLNIVGLNMYLPQTAISDGASSKDGFSTISSICIDLFLITPGLITPYLWTSSLLTLLTAITDEFVSWCEFNNWSKQDSAEKNKSSDVNC